MRVRLNANPFDACSGEVTKVRTGAWANLQHGAREVGKEARPVSAEIPVRLVPAPRHEPGEHPEAERASASAEKAGSSLWFGAMPDQYY